MRSGNGFDIGRSGDLAKRVFKAWHIYLLYIFFFFWGGGLRFHNYVSYKCVCTPLEMYFT